MKFSTLFCVMDQRERDSEVLHLSGEQQGEVELTSDPSVLPPGSPDQTKQPTQGEEVDNSDEWDTDLEIEGKSDDQNGLRIIKAYSLTALPLPGLDFRCHQSETEFVPCRAVPEGLPADRGHSYCFIPPQLD